MARPRRTVSTRPQIHVIPSELSAIIASFVSSPARFTVIFHIHELTIVASQLTDGDIFALSSCNKATYGLYIPHLYYRLSVQLKYHTSSETLVPRIRPESICWAPDALLKYVRHLKIQGTMARPQSDEYPDKLEKEIRVTESEVRWWLKRLGGMGKLRSFM